MGKRGPQPQPKLPEGRYRSLVPGEGVVSVAAQQRGHRQPAARQQQPPMNLVHSDLRNRSGPEHLNVCMRIAASKHTYKTFDMQAAHKRWLQAATGRGRYMSDR